MNLRNIIFMLIAIIIMIVFFFYFGSGAMINGRMSGNGWMGVNNATWIPTVIILVFGVLLGLVLFRNKKKKKDLF